VTGGFCFQPPAVVEQPSWELGSPEWEGDDLRHGRNDAGPVGSAFGGCAQDLRICVQISRMTRIRTSLTNGTHHEIMITDEY
jgi:hypothetical protein